jgi:hypothetical protein
MHSKAHYNAVQGALSARGLFFKSFRIPGFMGNPLIAGFIEIQVRLDPNKISGVSTIFVLLVHVFPGPQKQRAFKPSTLLS